MKTLRVLILAMLPALAMAQNPNQAQVQILFNNGSAALQYMCTAPSTTITTFTQVIDSSLTSVTVATNVATVTTASAHGLWVGARVTVTGSTVAALNSTYTVATVGSGTTYTFATSGVSDATYNNAALMISTRAPRLNDPRWSVTVLSYVSTVLDHTYSANEGVLIKCTDRTLY